MFGKRAQAGGVKANSFLGPRAHRSIVATQVFFLNCACKCQVWSYGFHRILASVPARVGTHLAFLNRSVGFGSESQTPTRRKSPFPFRSSHIPARGSAGCESQPRPVPPFFLRPLFWSHGLLSFGGAKTYASDFPLRGIWQGESRLYLDQVIVMTVLDFRRLGSTRFISQLKRGSCASSINWRS
jgi:hypothetical protein